MNINLKDFEKFKELDLTPKYKIGEELTFCITQIDSEGKESKRNVPVEVTDIYLFDTGEVEYDVKKLNEDWHVGSVEEWMLKSTENKDAILLEDAIELIEGIIGYVPEYFMDKHKYQEDYDSIMKRYDKNKDEVCEHGRGLNDYCQPCGRIHNA